MHPSIHARTTPDKPAYIMAGSGETVTYAELDGLANRYAHWAKGQGLRRGQTVALLMPNRIDYLAIWYGLSKVGVASALINNQITGQALAHCLNVSGASHLICDTETAPEFEAVRTSLSRSLTDWVLGGGVGQGDRDFDRALKGVSSLRPDGATVRASLSAKEHKTLETASREYQKRKG